MALSERVLGVVGVDKADTNSTSSDVEAQLINERMYYYTCKFSIGSQSPHYVALPIPLIQISTNFMSYLSSSPARSSP